MPVVPINISMQSYPLNASRASSQRVVNGYAERHPDAKSKVTVIGSPGIADWATCGSGPVRGMWTMGGVPYVVSGNSLYSIDENGVSTNLGGGIVGSGVVSMADNGTEVIIVDGSFGWVYDVTNGLRTITSSNFYPCNTVTVFKGLFCFDRIGTNEFFHSELLDGFTYDPLNSGEAETSSDLVVAVVEYRGHLIVMGEKTIEPWFFTGTVVFPFQQYDGAVVQRGIAAPRAFVKEDDGVFFLADDKNIIKMAGTSPQVVSTHAVADAIQKMPTLEDSYAFTLSFSGHKFIVFQFPSSHQTWVYDIASGFWHERDSQDIHDDNVIRWRGSCSTLAYNRTLVGDFLSGKVGYIDTTIATEFGDPIRMKLTFPVIHGEGRMVFCNYFELDMQEGVGLSGGVQGSDPQVMASLSVDGGDQFYPLQDWISLGGVGRTQLQMRWNALGSFYDGVIKVEITDPVLRTVIASRADVDLEAA